MRSPGENLGSSRERLLLNAADCAIKETLRVRPIVGAALRRLTAAMPIGEHTATGGSLLGASMIRLHGDPDLYPEPEAFPPERFYGKRSNPRRRFVTYAPDRGARSFLVERRPSEANVA